MRPLKFKEIRKSIINQKEAPNMNISPTTSPLKRKLFSQIENQNQMSFKSIQKSTMSPLKQTKVNEQTSTNKKKKFCFQQSAQKHNLSPLSQKRKFSQIQKSQGMFIYDSDRKNIKNQKFLSNFGSEQKQNQGNSIYINGTNEKKSFNQAMLKLNLNERKLNTTRNNFDNSTRHQVSANYLYETTKNPTPGSLNKKNSSSMLFKTALQTSNKKKTLRNNYDSERTNQRESSIGKLKEKLFGMKKIISGKQNIIQNQSVLNGQQTKSFTIYTKKDSSEDKEKCFKNKKQSLSKYGQEMSFSNLVLDSGSQNLTKGTYKNFLNVQDKKESVFNKVLFNMNESRADSVNISLVQSRSSILDMSPNL